MAKSQEEIINSLINIVGELIEITERHENEIESLKRTIIAEGELVNNQNEGIRLIMQVLNDNGLIDVDN